MPSKARNIHPRILAFLTSTGSVEKSTTISTPAMITNTAMTAMAKGMAIVPAKAGPALQKHELAYFYRRPGLRSVTPLFFVSALQQRLRTEKQRGREPRPRATIILCPRARSLQIGHDRIQPVLLYTQPNLSPPAIATPHCERQVRAFCIAATPHRVRKLTLLDMHQRLLAKLTDGTTQP